MEESHEVPTRKGYLKYFGVSKLDIYVYFVFSISFFALVVSKVMNRIFDIGWGTSYISWVDALQIAILWAILGFVSNSYYIKHKKK
jgi:hypothetical protein